MSLVSEGWKVREPRGRDVLKHSELFGLEPGTDAARNQDVGARRTLRMFRLVLGENLKVRKIVVLNRDPRILLFERRDDRFEIRCGCVPVDDEPLLLM